MSNARTCVAALIDRLDHASVETSALVARHGLAAEAMRAVRQTLVERRQSFIGARRVLVEQQLASRDIGIGDVWVVLRGAARRGPIGERLPTCSTHPHCSTRYFSTELLASC